MRIVSGCVGFTGKHGCQKCTVVGEYGKKFRKMSFPNIESIRRTDASFRSRQDSLHHKEYSIFEKLNIDMIYTFISSDSLHLFDLGIMRKCMFRWVYGENGYIRKWTKDKIANTSQLLERCQKYMPKEIHRAVRNLDCLRKWKGTEYRTLLLYVGMVVLKPVLNTSEYNHFLVLVCAVWICYSKSYKHYLPIAEKMFKFYIQQYINLYGRHSIGSNVHLLAHVVEEMEKNKIDSLMDVSTYKYENSLRILGLQIKHGYRPLEQVSRRCFENSNMNLSIHEIFETEKNSPKVFYKNIRESIVTWDNIQISNDFVLSNRKTADSWFLTQTDKIVRMIYAIKEYTEYKILGAYIEQKNKFFSHPITSIKLKIFESDGKENDQLQFFDISSITAKMICLPHNDKFVFVPLIHTFQNKIFEDDIVNATPMEKSK